MTRFELIEVNPWFSIVKYEGTELKVNFKEVVDRDGKLNIAMIDFETGVTLMKLVSTVFNLSFVNADDCKNTVIVNKRKDTDYVNLLLDLDKVSYKKDLTESLALYEINQESYYQVM